MRFESTVLVIAIASIGSIASIACEAVPDLVFVDGGGTSSGDGAAGDGAGITDAGTDSGSDATSDVEIPVCPTTPPPPGVTKCCSTSPCISRSNPDSGCDDCTPCTIKNCGTQVCCLNDQGNASCHAKPEDCH